MKYINKTIRACMLSTGLLFHMGSGLAARVDLQIGDATYQIELAVTNGQRQQGLMHRIELGPREGMLLVYPEPGNRRIWMKNVPISLWVFWIDENYVVLDKHRLPPCSTQPCPTYGTRGKAKYVLELGDYEHLLDPGDRIDALKDL